MKLIPLKEVVALRGVPYHRLLGWCRAGQMRFVNMSESDRKNYWVDLEWVDAMLASRVVEKVDADDAPPPSATGKPARQKSDGNLSVAEINRRGRQKRQAARKQKS